MMLAAASAVLLARNSSPSFSRAPSVQVVKDSAHHDQRPRFDDNSPRYSSPSAGFVLSLPLATHADVTPATGLPISFHTKGARYNRPPPAA